MSNPRNLRRRIVSLVTVGALLGAGLVAGATAASGVESPLPDKSYTSTDNGDGTYTVPLLNSDVPDVSVTMVPAAENDEHRDIYYMISTTMHLSPGAPIMKSYDLVNWETVNYVYNRLSIGDALSLRNGKESYGQGQWASSIRYHDGRFYVLFNTNNVNGAYLFTTDDVDDGAWEKTALGRGFHDPSLFFDTDGTPYIFYGAGGTSAVKLSADLKTVVAEYPNIFTANDYAGQPYIGGLFEGAQVYKIGEYYYIFIVTWPSGQDRQEVVFRSKYLLGKHQAPGGTNTYEARSALNSNGFAQGGLVEITHKDAASDWYGFFFRDTYPTGRIPALIPATWTAGWPTFGTNGVVPFGGTFDKPIRLTPAQENLERQKSVVASDDFDNDAAHKAYLDEQWEIPAGPNIDQSKIGVELFQNPGFESGTTGWAVNDTATLTAATSAHSGSGAVQVTARATTGSGPVQNVTGTLQHGVTYDISGWVKYDNAASPATKQFFLTARYGNGTFTNLGTGTVTKGQWGKLTGTFTVPDTQPLDSAQIFVETPWTPSPSADPNTHLMDFAVDDVSLVGRPATTELPNAAEIAFNGSTLDTAWEWNHNPDNRYWSLTDRDGWLRLTAGKAVTGASTYAKLSARDELAWFEEARNTLSQRTFSPTQSVETKLDVSAMKDGDVAGIATYIRSFAYAAVKKVDGEYTLGVVYRGQPFSATFDQAAAESFVPGSTVSLGSNRQVSLKADLDYASNNGQLYLRYYYSFDGQQWSQLGQRTGPLEMDWSLAHFMGYRMGLFNYATQSAGGSVDFDYYYLSSALTADGRAVSGAKLDAAIAQGAALDESDYPAQAWAQFESAYDKAVAAKAAGFSTQNQVDAPAKALTRQIAELAVLKEASAPTVDASVTTTWRCVAGKAVLTVTVTNDDAVPVKADVTTPFGTKSFASVAAGKSQSQAFTTRLKSVEAGTGSVVVSATKEDQPVSATLDAAYAANTCS
ncbi:family 43 glycosylhydrolase [Microbacterium sp. C23T]